MFDPGPCVYMEKLAGGPEIADCLSLDEPIGDVVERVAERRGVSPTEITTVDPRPRAPRRGRRQIREAGSRIRFITDGDVSAALLAVTEGTGVDLLWGIGGTPEGVHLRGRDQVPRRRDPRPPLAARRRRAQGGDRRRLRPRPGPHRRTTSSAATTPSSPPPASPTATCSRASATTARHATTESLVMRSRSGTVRKVSAPPRPGEAARGHRRALRLSEPGDGPIAIAGATGYRRHACSPTALLAGSYAVRARALHGPLARDRAPGSLDGRLRDRQGRRARAGHARAGALEERRRRLLPRPLDGPRRRRRLRRARPPRSDNFAAAADSAGRRADHLPRRPRRRRLEAPPLPPRDRRGARRRPASR